MPDGKGSWSQPFGAVFTYVQIFVLLSFVAENRKLQSMDKDHTCGLGMCSTSIRAQCSKFKRPVPFLACQYSAPKNPLT